MALAKQISTAMASLDRSLKHLSFIEKVQKDKAIASDA